MINLLYSAERNAGESKYPQIKKKIIYLDQFVISNIANILYSKKRDTIDPIWKKLYEKLNKLVKLQVIVCPASNFHVNESRMKTELHDKFWIINRKLSTGVSFRNDHEIKRIQVLEYVKCWLDQKNPAKSIALDKICVFCQNPHWWQAPIAIYHQAELSESWRNEVQEILTDTMQNYQKVLERRWLQQKGMPARAFFKAVANEEGRDFGRVVLNRFYSRMREMMDNDGIDVTAVADILLSNPSPSLMVITGLMEIFMYQGRRDGLIQSVIDYLESPVMGDLPFSKISGALFAADARKQCAGKLRSPTVAKASIITDIDMISTLLPYCDVMIVDNLCQEYLSDNAVREFIDCNTLVFARRNIQDFIDYLDAIEYDISAEHVSLVKSVYGDSWVD